MARLTVQCMVRNEPFLLYAVRSVYLWADRILLWDTGSDDEHTLNDISLLLDWDWENQKKIDFRHVSIDVDETQWTMETCRDMRLDTMGKGLRGKGHVRREMLEETDTEFFMILDGDEIHYSRTMIAIRDTITNWPKGACCGYVPILWFYDPHRVYTDYPFTNRIFSTASVEVITASPGEKHVERNTNLPLIPQRRRTFLVDGAMPMCHFSHVLKPWRRGNDLGGIKDFTGLYPEVMKEDGLHLVARFINEQDRNRTMVNETVD